MIDEKYTIRGQSGDDSQPSEPDPPRTPVEAPNDLRSKAVARIFDMIGEGEIEGLVGGLKGVYFNSTPVQAADGSMNFNGIQLETREGLPDQLPMSSGDGIEVETAVNEELKYGEVHSRNILADSSTDDVIVKIAVPRLSETDETTGDVGPAQVSVEIYVSANGGMDQIAGVANIEGKCISTYERSVRISNLSRFGPGPWTIKVKRYNEDSTTQYLQNRTYWTSYIEVINDKLIYPDTAYVKLTLDAEQFGSRIPRRAYHVKGLKVNVPSNYDPATRTYDGIWDGTFKRAWTDNPAWVYYDLLTVTRYGLGLDESELPGISCKWTLYTIAQYCDEMVDDGFGGQEPRFSCHCVIQERAEAFHVLNMLAGAFQAMPFWGPSQAMIVQDSPKEPTRQATPANVEAGRFVYEGSAVRARHTVAMVSYNNPDDMFRLGVQVVQDDYGIERYGWRPLETTAFGCKSRGQALRLGRWMLESDTNQTDTVTYTAGFDHADCMPGEIVTVMDPAYSEIRHGGRVVSCNEACDEVVLDNPFEFEVGESYTLSVNLPDGTIESVPVVNPEAETATVPLGTPLSKQLDPNAIWVITDDASVIPRQFRVLKNVEKSPNKYEITGVLHDPQKYARIEEGINFDQEPEPLIPLGKLTMPQNLTVEEYSYVEGQNHKFGAIIGWEHSTDPRVSFYEVQMKEVDAGPYYRLGETHTNSYEIRPILGGDYQFRVRAVGMGGQSEWLSSDTVTIHADPSPIPAPTGLQVVGGGTEWTGRDCEVEWAPVDNVQLTEDNPPYSHSSKLKDYVVCVYPQGGLVGADELRTEYVTDTRYTYTLQKNIEDNGTPIRDLTIRVWSRDVYDKWSQTPAAENVSNPVPSYSGYNPSLLPVYNGFKLDWSSNPLSDPDLLKFELYLEKGVNPPTTVAQTVDRTEDSYYFTSLDASNLYYCKILPYDEFGAGVASNVVSAEPLVIPETNIDIELQQNLEMSDSEDRPHDTLSVLYDGVKDSGGISFVQDGSDKWVQYDFPVDYIVDRVAVWPDQPVSGVYFAYSANGTDWSYLCGESDHTLDPNGALVAATGKADAETNYVDLDAGKNVLLFPQGVAGRFFRMYTTDDGTFHELVFRREVLAEEVVAEQLSAISSNIGSIVAGVLQSYNWSATEGMLFDLDNEEVKFGGNDDPKFHWDGTSLQVQGVVIGDVSLTPAADGLYLTKEHLGYYDATAGEWGVSIDNDGSFRFKGDNDNYVEWDGSVMTVRGSLDASDLTTGTLSASRIGAGTITASHIGADTISATHIVSSTITASEVDIGAGLNDGQIDYSITGSMSLGPSAFSSQISHSAGRFPSVTITEPWSIRIHQYGTSLVQFQNSQTDGPDGTTVSFSYCIM